MKRLKITISKGNAKIGGVANFSLPPVKSCGQNCKYCFDPSRGLYCYANRDHKRFPSCRRAWDSNLKAVQKDPDGLEAQLAEYLAAYKKTLFRIHVSGDFVNQAYLDLWIRLARRFKAIRFLAFTKQFHLDFSAAPRNLKILFSAMPAMPTCLLPEKGSRAYVGKHSDYRLRKGERLFECMGNCETCGYMCWHLRPSESVLLPIH